jgi:hypothetical protein
MSDFVIGIPIGMAIGIAIGINIGKKQKPWSELTEEEKKVRKVSVGIGFAALLIGMIVFFWRLSLI